MSRTFPIALLALAAIGGCLGGSGGTTSSASSGGNPEDGGLLEAGDATVTCQHDPRVDTYVANLSKTSASGALKVTLVASDPAPPAVGTNGWTLLVTDGAGTPISGAALTVASFMPDHGHGSSVRAVVTPQADGHYSITPLYLFMPGVWRVTLALPVAGADAGAPAEQVQFFFCIEG